MHVLVGAVLIAPDTKALNALRLTMNSPWITSRMRNEHVQMRKDHHAYPMHMKAKLVNFERIVTAQARVYLFRSCERCLGFNGKSQRVERIFCAHEKRSRDRVIHALIRTWK
jgi:hypothetical protein